MKNYIILLAIVLNYKLFYSQQIVTVFRYKKVKIKKEDKHLEKIKKSEIILYNDSTYKYYYKTNKFKKNRKKGVITGLYEIRDKYKVVNGEIVFYQNKFEIFKSSNFSTKIKFNEMEFFLKNKKNTSSFINPK